MPRKNEAKTEARRINDSTSSVADTAPTNSQGKSELHFGEAAGNLGELSLAWPGLAPRLAGPTA